MKKTSSYFFKICKNYSHLQVQRNHIAIPRRKRAQKDLKSVMGLVIMLTVLRNFTRTNIMRLLTWPLLASRIDLRNQVMQYTKIWRHFFSKHQNNGKEYTTELQEVAILKFYGDDFNEIELTTQLGMFN